ncbi:Flavonol synthase/flavanone 3-hydroxylase [Purpureocillium lavendulum]|uniref:Flavonol synthase/flavanone 3-hydroxylase n=1 Tax=Purpureocillium lavendulum TaxID=1247861 RepID=A0AB34FQ96_9HYPO|nr:Flavonol synthase/flavanone 3-hydroxylase [Purpureocillium lavendulum]
MRLTGLFTFVAVTYGLTVPPADDRAPGTTTPRVSDPLTPYSHAAVRKRGESKSGVWSHGNVWRREPKTDAMPPGLWGNHRLECSYDKYRDYADRGRGDVWSSPVSIQPVPPEPTRPSNSSSPTPTRSMSWSREDDYEAFKAAAHHSRSSAPRPWSLLVWDASDAHPEGNWHVESSPECLRSKAQLRIVFSALHGGGQGEEWLASFLELFRILHVPSDFTTERTQSVCHSFGRRTDRHGRCSWFHFLFKNISVRRERGKMPEVDLRIPGRWQQRGAASLPQADYSWLVASFFLRVHAHGGVTLVCFGAPPHVRRRFELLVENGGWGDVRSNPYVLFDVLLEGLYFEVDEMVWNMNTIFGPLEHSILELAHTKDYGQLNARLSFAALHNCAKHIIYLGEGLDAALLVLDSALTHADDFETELLPQASPGSARPTTTTSIARLVTRQVKERLGYRRSLFRSTQLRLSSLHKRIDNSIALAFNVVTQKDSMVVTRDSSVMKMIAAITMVFLPTTGVATVVGSQLLVSEWQKDSQSWSVMVTPLFWITWWITIPLTVCVVVVAVVWQWWWHSERAQGETRRIMRKPVQFLTSAFKEKATVDR